ncbi:hypothetical protein D3C72_1915250 [compost metagenome]
MSAPWTAIRWHIQGTASSVERRLRVQTMACNAGKSSVCTNRLLKAGCMASLMAGARTTSA